MTFEDYAKLSPEDRLNQAINALAQVAAAHQASGHSVPVDDDQLTDVVASETDVMRASA